MEGFEGPAGRWIVKPAGRHPHGNLALLRELAGASVAAWVGLLVPAIELIQLPAQPAPAWVDSSLTGRILQEHAGHATPDAPMWYRPPVPGPAPAAGRPASTEIRLRNGLTALLVEQHDRALVTVRARIEWPARRTASGLVALWSSLVYDSESEPKHRLALELAIHGAHFVKETHDADAAYVQWTVVSSELAPTLAAFGAALRRPHFAPERVVAARTRLLDAIAAQAWEERLIQQARQWLFAGHRYQDPVGGQAVAVARLGPAEVERFARESISPARITLGVAGDTTRAQLAEALERAAGDWVAPREAPRRPPPKLPRGTLVLDDPQATDVQLAVVLPAPSLAAPESWVYPIAWRTTTARLWDEIPESKRSGWQHPIHGYERYAEGGLAFFRLRVSSDGVAGAVREYLSFLDRMSEAPSSAERLGSARASATEPSSDPTESNDALVRYLVASPGGPRNAALEPPSPQAVARSAATFFVRKEARLVLRGRASELRAVVERLGLGPPTVRSAEELR